MLGLIKTVWHWLSIPNEESSAEKIRNWRLSVLVIALVGPLVAAASFGLLPGISGFAYGSDIDEKITASLSPIEDRLKSIENSQTALTAGMRRLVKADIANEIYANKMAWCNATGAREKQRLRLKIDDAQTEYESASGKGHRVTEPACD